MSAIEVTEAFCLFHNTAGGVEAGGCTKEWLDDADGDPSGLFAGTYDPVVAMTGVTYTHATKNLNKTNIGVGAEVGMVAYVSGTNITTDRYKVTAVTDNDNIVCSGIVSTGDNTDADVNVGGAFSDLQDTLDQADADLFDCWVFTSSDFTSAASAGGASHTIYGTSDGNYQNNTKLYIIGYKTNAYDALPVGHGYFPDGIGDGANYVSGFDWAKNDHADADIKAKLVKMTEVVASGWRHIFANESENNSDNVIIMGFYCEIDAHSTVATMAGVGHDASFHVRHCCVAADGYDGAPGYTNAARILLNNGDGGGGEVYDCFGKGVNPVSVNADTDHQTYYEVHHNFMLHATNVADLDGTGHLHHNVFKHFWKGTGVYNDNRWTINNNVFYDVLLRCVLLNSTGSSGVYFYNNIVVVDDQGVGFQGILTAGASGGSVHLWDHNLYWSMDDQAVASDKFIYSSRADWQAPAIPASHDIEADPMFVDAANNDFRPRNPAAITGGKPVDGVATYIGAVGAKHNFKSNARTANFGRLSITRS